MEGGQPVATVDLSGSRILLGRDESSDFVLDQKSISRRHALVERIDDQLFLRDLGSANGTSLNGMPVLDPVEIHPGDEICLAGAVFLRVHETARGHWPRILVVSAAVLALGGSLGLLEVRRNYWYWAATWDPTLASASEMAEEGVEAWRRGEAAPAKRNIQAAYWTLYNGGLLDDVPRTERWAVGLERLGATAESEEGLAEIFRQATDSKLADQKHGPAGAGRPNCRLDRASPREFEPCLHAYVRWVSRELRQDDERIPDWFYRDVARTLGRERDAIRSALPRRDQYAPSMGNILESRHMPRLLHYLSMAESGYRTDARSPAGAVGQWQFMPATARRYGLEVSGKTDERKDPDKSTRAAAEYLRDLALEFGGDSLLLALAGYNRGENGVRRSLRSLEDPFSDRSYWRLVERELLPKETGHYVARIFAQAVAGEGGIPSREALSAVGY
jgi:hypothetical protein